MLPCGLTKKVIGFLFIVIVVDVFLLAVFYEWQSSHNEGGGSGDVTAPLPPSDSKLGVFNRAAVVAVGVPCAGIGKDILARGGSVVDSAIATQLCEGVCVMQSNGVGAGSIMTIYNKADDKVYSLISRETAPGRATRDMFVNHTTWSTAGPLSIGVPGQLKGFQAAWEKFGVLPWKDLFTPTIKLCLEGIPVNKMLARNFVLSGDLIRNSSSFMKIMLNSTGGQFPKEGDYLKLPVLAQTLSVIAESPKMADELYNGSLTSQFVADIQAAGGIITEEDMRNYNVRWEEPIVANISDGMTLYSSPLPGSGVLIAFILRLLDGLIQFADSDLDRFQLILEAFKHAYGRRTHLSDPHFANETELDKVLAELTEPSSILAIRELIKSNWTTENVTYYGADPVTDDHGTNHMVFMGPDGSAVSVTSTINLWFGSKFVSESTGILLNNQMDDFSTPGRANSFKIPPSPANYIEPGKRPMSSMSPTIILDRDRRVRLVVGAAGGSKIISQTALTIIRNLWLGKNIKEAIDLPRFHHQLIPMTIEYESGILKDIVDGWRRIGHKAERASYPVDFIAVVTGIALIGDNITANCDWRRPGFVDGF